MDSFLLGLAILTSFGYGVTRTRKHYLEKEREKIEEKDRSEIASLKNEINELKRKMVDMSNCENNPS
jgi:hypothetical protein